MRWNPCVEHLGDKVEQFIDQYFSCSNRRCLLIAGSGFDPRTARVSESLVKALNDRVCALFLRENRPSPSSTTIERAIVNLSRLSDLIPHHTTLDVQIFSDDNTPIGGREVVKLLTKQQLDEFTDIVIDLTALSLGIAFPIVRYLVTEHSSLNNHLMMCSSLHTEGSISPVSGDEMRFIHGFQGEFGLDEHVNSARLWLPQLSSSHRLALRRIKDDLDPHDICPIIPFPSTDPRLTEKLMEGFIEEFDGAWEIDPSSLLYAAQTRPSDLYRTLIQLHDRRQAIFQDLGGSLLILSPLGSKPLATGALMAAIERDMPVAYVETLDYDVDWNRLDEVKSSQGELIHVWLTGDAYPKPV